MRVLDDEQSWLDFPTHRAVPLCLCSVATLPNRYTLLKLLTLLTLLTYPIVFFDITLLNYK